MLQSRAEQSRAEQSRAEQYLSKKMTMAWKGILAIGVLVHHIYQYCGVLQGTVLGIILQMLGYLSVGGFFFFTGYGLMVSSKGSGYIRHFGRSRILPLYLLYVILILAYSIYEAMIGKTISVQSLIQSFLFGGTVVPLGWYLQASFIVYLLFWGIAAATDRVHIRIFGMGIMLTIYCILSRCCGLATTWYESIFCVLLGMAWACYKQRIDEVITKSSGACFAGAICLFAITALGQYVDSIAIVSKMLSALSFCSVVATMSYVLTNTRVVDNPLTQWLGKHSLGIYVVQGFFLLMQRNHPSVYGSTIMFCIFTFFGTIVISTVVHPIYIGIVKLCKPAQL